MEKTKVILAIFLAIFLCLAIFAVHAVPDPHECYARINGVSLNGQGDYLKIEPGAYIRIVTSYETGTIHTLSDKGNVIVVGFEDLVMGYIPCGYLDKDRGNIVETNWTYGIVAPTEPGIYYFMQRRAEWVTNADAMQQYRDDPSTRTVIATIEVKKSDEPETWEGIYEKDTDLYPKDPYVDECYRIIIWQRGNDIQIEIGFSDPNRGMHTGSVSISVDENILVDYDTGDVSAIRFGEDHYREVIPDPLALWEDKSFWLLAGLIPGVGFCTNVIGYIDDITESANVVDESCYYEDDRTMVKPIRPRVYFESNEAANWRDIVVIPWRVDEAATAIKINCPQMSFPNTNTYTIVFRIDFFPLSWKIRHDIALPIEFVSTGAVGDKPMIKRRKW